MFDKCTFEWGELSRVAVLIQGVGGQRFRAFASFGQKWFRSWGIPFYLAQCQPLHPIMISISEYSLLSHAMSSSSSHPLSFNSLPLFVRNDFDLGVFPFVSRNVIVFKKYFDLGVLPLFRLMTIWNLDFLHFKLKATKAKGGFWSNSNITGFYDLSKMMPCLVWRGRNCCLIDSTETEIASVSFSSPRTPNLIFKVAKCCKTCYERLADVHSVRCLRFRIRVTNESTFITDWLTSISTSK